MRAVVGSIGAVFASLCFIGCSDVPADRPTIVPVRGKITYNGKPVAGALVTFSSLTTSRPANAMTDSDGRFSLTTFDSKDGAVPGEHQVTITKSAPPTVSSDPAMATAPDLSKGLPPGYPVADKTGKVKLPSGAENLLPAKYANPTESQLTVTVSATEKNEFTFDLKD